MRVRTKLSKELVKALDVAEDELRCFIWDQRNASYGMSERWKGSDRATEVSDWLDHLEELAERLGNCYGTAG